MLEETTTIRSKAIFSDDKEHRLLLRKEWDSEKPTAMVIMINPNTADTVNFDMTTMLVLNNVSRLGFGSVNIVFTLSSSSGRFTSPRIRSTSLPSLNATGVSLPE